MSAKRLAFRLPEYAPRTTWASTHARQVWEPRLQRISNVWLGMERLLVAEGLRPSALQNVTPEELPALIADVAENGLTALPLGQTARASGYQSVATVINGAWDYRCAITRLEHASAWLAAWRDSDNETIGKLLGYPKCCREFFEQAWVKERWFDTTWPMVHSEEDAVEVPAGIGILWRWYGVRTVSHLPCSFSCEASRKQTESTLALMQLAYPDEARWLAEITSWPVEWSALHGIAELRTPITRTSVPTDATANKLTVRYMGTGYPVEGAQGLKFPHRQSVPKPIVRLSNSRDNGFATYAAMQDAHSKLLAALNPPYGTVVDLGCGDGLLLSKIAAKRRVGVECDPRVAKLAENRLDKVIVDNCTNKDLVSKITVEEKPDLVIAQRDRNPSIDAPLVLYYSYEDGYVRLHRRDNS